MKKSQLSFGLLLLLSVVVSASSFAQNRKTENLVVITLDGLRWQEVFQGLDKVIVKQEMFTKNAKGLRESFAADATESSRQKIFPFLWSTVAKEGQIYGNRLKGSLVNVKNKYQFSYPGYNELFTGFPDVRINSNDNINNPNENVFEFIQKQPGYENEVAVFATWETMPYILNRDRSGLNINADRDSFPALSPELKLLDDLQKLVTRPVEVRLDSLTYMGAREYMKVKHPKVMYISFGETDEFAHEKEYDQYIKTAHSADSMIADLWTTLQAMEQYRDKTTFVITCDHGRGGLGRDTWAEHGDEIPESGQIWMAFLGPDTKALGEVKNSPQLYQGQMATTLARFLGLEFKTNHPTMTPFPGVSVTAQ